MLDYNQIEKLFGAPLSSVPQPFKITPLRLILAGVFLILSGLGIVFIYQKIASSVRRLLPKKEEPTLILPPKPAKEDKPKTTVTIPINEKEDSNEVETPHESIQSKFYSGDYTDHPE